MKNAHEELVDLILAEMNQCKEAVEGGSRCSDFFHVRGAVVYFTGDMSWGDVPEEQKAFCIFSASPGYEAAGFES